MIILLLSVSQQYLYTDLAAKERAHFTPEADTPNMGLARKMKVVYSDVSPPRAHSYFNFSFHQNNSNVPLPSNNF